MYIKNLEAYVYGSDEYMIMYMYLRCSVVRKMAQYMADILGPEDRERLQENLLVGQSKVWCNVYTCMHNHKYIYFSRLQWIHF